MTREKREGLEFTASSDIITIIETDKIKNAKESACPVETENKKICLSSATVRFAAFLHRRQSKDHNEKVCDEYVTDLNEFISERLGNKLVLGVSKESKDELVGQGLTNPSSEKLSLDQTLAAVDSLAVFHAAGLAYRMSVKSGFEQKYPWLMEDIYTSGLSKELIARHLDSFLHCLSYLPGVEKTVAKLRKIEHDLFQYLVSLRRPTDALGSRFSTICHGDVWQENLLFKVDDNAVRCTLRNFYCSSYLSPASDLAYLILANCSRSLTLEYWEQIIEHYYNTFNTTLTKFGLILRHLGTSYNHFRQEVERALAGQFLVVTLVIPIIALFGPLEYKNRRDSRRRSSSSDRQNTVRHLVQMMSITEEMNDSSEEDADEDKENLPSQLRLFLKDDHLKNYARDLLLTAEDLHILDFIRPEPRHRASSWDKTKRTTAKYKPNYNNKAPNFGTPV